MLARHLLLNNFVERERLFFAGAVYLSLTTRTKTSPNLSKHCSYHLIATVADKLSKDKPTFFDFRTKACAKWNQHPSACSTTFCQFENASILAFKEVYWPYTSLNASMLASSRCAKVWTGKNQYYFSVISASRSLSAPSPFPYLVFHRCKYALAFSYFRIASLILTFSVLVLSVAR